MLDGLLQTNTVPLLEQVVNFSQARHNLLAATSRILIHLAIKRRISTPTSSPSNYGRCWRLKKWAEPKRPKKMGLPNCANQANSTAWNGAISCGMITGT